VQLHHIAFRTGNVTALERFYVDLLGFAVRERKPQGSVWLAAGPVILMLEARDANEPGIPAASMELTAFAITPADRATVRARLEAAGVRIEGETAFSLYFRDPDGRRVGVSHYPD
jgi:glyoxylase I family protein